MAKLGRTSTKVDKPQPLVGKELLEKVRQLSGSKSSKAEACGYYIITKAGVRRVKLLAFMNALLEAEGILKDKEVKGNGRIGKVASYKASVQRNGNLLIGSAYTKQLNLEPGDEFEISLGRRDIRLTRVMNEDN